MNIVLRKVSLEDGHYIVKWRNSKNALSHAIDQREISEESNAEFFEKYVKTGKYMQYMVEKMGEDFGVYSYPIATVFLRNIDKDNHKCEIGLYPSDDQEWNDEAKIEAVRKLISVANSELGMHKVYAEVLDNCQDEVELFENAGMTIEGTLKDDFLINGEYRSVVRLVAIA